MISPSARSWTPSATAAFWTNTCLFAVEDDPQSGADHVSGFRTTAYVASPYTSRRVTVSTQYNQTSLLRTMELMLGLPPMNQMDATATPMFDCFTNTPRLHRLQRRDQQCAARRDESRARRRLPTPSSAMTPTFPPACRWTSPTNAPKTCSTASSGAPPWAANPIPNGRSKCG